ncbi:MAG: DUF4290 domain-containing protein [Bacteroidales bacterium]|nr:DUF4290 domain-containing protein [Bacteroidales bacterium]
MEANEHTIKLYYNTEVEKLKMPEYGRNVLKMVEDMKAEPDREKRSRQAAGIVRVMELLNPQVHQQENFAQKLWDHLYLIAGLDLDIDAPYPAPEPEIIASRPEIIPLKKRPLKARHYGRNIESIIDLIATEPEGEVKTAMIRSLAIYMRQQYLIWNKDSVSDATIFQDIERLSEGRVKVPEGMELTKIQMDGRLARPMMNLNMSGRRNRSRSRGKKK